MTLQRLFLTACMCCMLGIGSVSAAPIDDAKAAHAKGDYAQAIKLFRPLAAQGLAEAQTRLGVMYQRGEGVPEDHQEALKWWRLAAAQSFAHAQFRLGVVYENAQDYQEALKWYSRAAAQGDKYAQVNLGFMYERGRGVPQNYHEALKWYRRAAAQKDAYAQLQLGWMYQRGEGVPQNYHEALKWYRRAAAQGHAIAQENLRNLEMVMPAQNAQPKSSVRNKREGWTRDPVSGVWFAPGYSATNDPMSLHAEQYRNDMARGMAQAQALIMQSYPKQLAPQPTYTSPIGMRFCTVFSYGKQCIYNDWNDCQMAAGSEGACIINQQAGRLPLLSGRPFCVTTGAYTDCSYDNAESCREAAVSSGGVCAVR